MSSSSPGLTTNWAPDARANESAVDFLVERIGSIPGLRAEKVRDEAGRLIFRCRVSLDLDASRGALTMGQVNDQLRGGDPVIWARTEFLDLGKVDFDPRPLAPGDKELIVRRLREIMEA